MATIQVTESSATITRRARYVVQMRVHWWDEWTTVNHLHPLKWINCVSPNMPQAVLVYDAGRILRADRPAGSAAAFQSYDFLPDANRLGHLFLIDGDDRSMLLDAFVRICAVLPGAGGGLVQHWIGVVVGNTPSYYGYRDFGFADGLASGTQTIYCLGLEHLLNLQVIDRAYCVNRAVDADDYVTVPAEDTIRRIRWAPDFNRSYGTGEPEGNRCDPDLAGPAFLLPGNVAGEPHTWLHAFGDDRGPDPAGPWADNAEMSAVWADADKVLYLLFFFQPFGNVNFRMPDELEVTSGTLQFFTVTAERLYGRGVITKQEGRTVWQLLNELAANEAGLAWSIRCVADDEASAEIVFSSHFADSVAFGGAQLAGNTDTVSLTVGDSARVLRCVVSESSAYAYDYVEAVGERVVACFSVSNRDGTLDKDWSDELETRYKQGAKTLADGSTNPAYSSYAEAEKEVYNDQARLADEFASVYRRFRIPRTWDWFVGNGEGGTTPYNVQCLVADDGGVQFGEQVSPAYYRWQHRRPILPSLPLAEGLGYWDEDLWDYSSFSDLTGRPAGVPGVVPRMRPGTPLRPIIAFLPVYVLGGYTSEEAYWIKVDDPAYLPDGSALSGAELRVTQDRMAIDVHYQMAHIIAGADWDTGTPPEPSQIDPAELPDWRDMVVTLAVELDERLRVRRQVNPDVQPSDPAARGLVIEVPEAHLWFVAPETMVDVDGDGQALRVPADTEPQNIPWARGVIRNDVLMVQAVAAVASAWVARRHYDVQIVVEGFGVLGLGAYGQPQPGQMLAELNPDTPQKSAIDAMITQVVTDNSGEQTVVSLTAGTAEVKPLLIAERGVIR